MPQPSLSDNEEQYALKLSQTLNQITASQKSFDSTNSPSYETEYKISKSHNDIEAVNSYRKKEKETGVRNSFKEKTKRYEHFLMKRLGITISDEHTSLRRRGRTVNYAE